MSDALLRLALTPLAAAALLLAAALLSGSSPGAAQPAACPYSGGGPAYLFQSWEAERDRSLYLNAQRLAARNLLFPDDEEFALPPLQVGPDRVEDPGAAIPAPLLYAIGWIESSMNQTAADVPYGEIGPALVSFDCGYGIMQVTSSIVNEGALPTRYESLVGTHFAYNIAAGARILAEKWNDDFFPQVGAHDPSLIESWYYALWGYNGWAISNHPAGPEVDPFRAPEYPCDGRRNGFPYQELVLGCVANPPLVDEQPLWPAVPVALPDLALTAAPDAPLDPAHFYAGWNEIRNVGADNAQLSPFRSMYMPLSDFAERYVGLPLDGAEAARLRGQILGRPALRLDDAELELSSSGGPALGASLMIANEGTGLLAWRIASAPSWVHLEVQAGVAVGAGAGQAGEAGASRLVVRAAAGGVPEGEHIGQLRLEAALPDGSTTSRTVTIFLNKLGAAFYTAGSPQS